MWHVNIILDFRIAVNMVVFFKKKNENTYRKGRELMRMYRVAPETKSGYSINNRIKIVKMLPK